MCRGGNVQTCALLVRGAMLGPGAVHRRAHDAMLATEPTTERRRTQGTTGAQECPLICSAGRPTHLDDRAELHHRRERGAAS